MHVPLSPRTTSLNLVGGSFVGFDIFLSLKIFLFSLLVLSENLWGWKENEEKYTVQKLKYSIGSTQKVTHDVSSRKWRENRDRPIDRSRVDEQFEEKKDRDICFWNGRPPTTLLRVRLLRR